MDRVSVVRWILIVDIDLETDWVQVHRLEAIIRRIRRRKTAAIADDRLNLIIDASRESAFRNGDGPGDRVAAELITTAHAAAHARKGYTLEPLLSHGDRDADALRRLLFIHGILRSFEIDVDLAGGEFADKLILAEGSIPKSVAVVFFSLVMIDKHGETISHRAFDVKAHRLFCAQSFFNNGGYGFVAIVPPISFSGKDGFAVHELTFN